MQEHQPMTIGSTEMGMQLAAKKLDLQMWPAARYAVQAQAVVTGHAELLTHRSMSMMPVTVGSCRSIRSEGGHTALPGMVKGCSGPVRVMGWSPTSSQPNSFSSLSAAFMWGTAAQAAQHC